MSRAAGKCCGNVVVARVLRQMLLAGTGGLAAMPALAQTQGGAEAGQATQLDTVTVTAQKRSERVQDVPMSISVVNAEKLASQGQVQLTDYFAQVPGLSMNARGSGRTQLVMRGISTNTGQNPTVGVVVDDVPFGSSTSDTQVPDIDPFDLQHIEVLRGPQGTLYGASSLGGLFKYVTVDPDTYGFSGRAQIDASTTAHGGQGYGGRVAMNIPVLADTFALRVSAFDRKDAGYVHDVLQDKDEVNEGRAKGARLAALWNASDTVTVRMAAMAQDSESDGTANVDMDFEHVPAYGKYSRERMGGTDGYEGKVRLYNLKLNADLGWATLDSISAYGEFDHDGPQDVTGTFGSTIRAVLGVSGAGAAIENRVHTEKYSQELRLASVPGGRLDWQAGAFFTKEDSQGTQVIVATDASTGAYLDYAPVYSGVTSSSYREGAIYGDVDYHFTPQFDLQLGGRYSDVTLESGSVYDGVLNGGYSSTTRPGSGDKVFTYLLSPRYKFSEELMVYGRVASGYRAGGQNGILPTSGDPIPESYGSDELVSYEAGIKGSFLDRRLSVDAALFYIDWSDIQLRMVDQSSGQSYYSNGGKASSKGVETSVSWIALEGLTMNWNAAYTDARLEQTLPSGTAGEKGDRLPFSPRLSGSFNVTREFPLGSLYAFVGAGLTYVGERLVQFSNAAATPRFEMPSYTTVDLRAGLEGDAWSWTVYLKNAGDEYGYLSATARNATTGQSLYGVGLIQPRTFGTSLAWRF